jgi:four helix bundle protein
VPERNQMHRVADMGGMHDEETGDGRQETGNGQPLMRIGSDIAERLLAFSVGALRLASRLPRDPAGRHVASQMFRSATGAGANYEEARAAESREDFVHKVGIAAKEARETVYWLTLIDRSGWSGTSLAPVLREAAELAAILGASARTARANARLSKGRPPPTDVR